MKGEAYLDCVLLVDDDDITNIINCRIIKKFNISRSTVVTKSGEEALKYIRENDAPDLIILDIHMPIMNGSEFLEAYFHNLNGRKKTRIVVLSSSVNLSDRYMAASHGLPFLKKPLSGEELLEIINKKSFLEEIQAGFKFTMSLTVLKLDLIFKKKRQVSLFL